MSMILLLLGFSFLYGPHILSDALLSIQDAYLPRLFESDMVSVIGLAPSILGTRVLDG